MPPRFNDDQLDAEVLFLLKQHRGRQSPIGRWEMVAKLYGPQACEPRTDDNVADRQVRESIARLRRQGVLVCDMGDGKGRFLASTLEEYGAFKAYFGAAAFEKIEIIREMDKAAAQEFPNELQPRLL